MKSNYALYLEELSNRQIYENEKGFFVYQIDKEEFYIQEIFVKQEFRRQGIASEYDRMATVLAKEANCKYIKGSVIPTAPKSTEALKLQLDLGYKLFYTSGPLIYLKKELGE